MATIDQVVKHLNNIDKILFEDAHNKEDTQKLLILECLRYAEDIKDNIKLNG